MRTLFLFSLAAHLYAFGDLKVEPRYLGQTLDLTGAAYQISVLVDGTSRGQISYQHRANQPTPASSLTITGLTAGAHTVTLAVANLSSFGTHSVNITDSTLTTDTPELSADLGALIGSLLVQGAAPTPTDAYALCGGNTTVHSCYFFTAGSPNFRILLPAGSRTGAVVKLPPPTVSVVKPVPYSITAGQDSNIGTVAHDFGELKIEPRFLSQTLPQLNAAFDLTVRLDGVTVGSINYSYHTAQPLSTGYLLLPNTSAGAHTVDFAINNFAFIASHTINVAIGGTTTDAFELSPYTGIIKGNVLVNGALPNTSNYFQVRHSPGSGPLAYYLALNNSAFRMLAQAGARNGSIVINTSGVIPFFFPYNAIPATETDLGTIAYNYGQLKIEPRYNGQTLDLTNAGYSFTANVDNLFANGMGYGHYPSQAPVTSLLINAIPAGNHTVEFSLNSLTTFGAHSINITQGILNTDNFDLSTVAGILKGNLYINGAPPSYTPPNYTYVCGNYVGIPQIAYVLNPGDPAYRLLLPAGTRNGCVVTAPPGVIKVFPYTITAGLETLLGDLFAINLLGAISNKSGTANARTWDFRLTNQDTSPVTINISNFALTQTFGTTCTPTRTTTLPVNYGAIAAGAFATQSFTFDFSSCPANARFTLNATASNGSATQDFIVANQFR